MQAAYSNRATVGRKTDYLFDSVAALVSSCRTAVDARTWLWILAFLWATERQLLHARDGPLYEVRGAAKRGLDHAKGQFSRQTTRSDGGHRDACTGSRHVSFHGAHFVYGGGL